MKTIKLLLIICPLFFLANVAAQPFKVIVSNSDEFLEAIHAASTTHIQLDSDITIKPASVLQCSENNYITLSGVDKRIDLNGHTLNLGEGNQCYLLLICHNDDETLYIEDTSIRGGGTIINNYTGGIIWIRDNNYEDIKIVLKNITLDNTNSNDNGAIINTGNDNNNRKITLINVKTYGAHLLYHRAELNIVSGVFNPPKDNTSIGTYLTNNSLLFSNVFKKNTTVTYTNLNGEKVVLNNNNYGTQYIYNIKSKPGINENAIVVTSSKKPKITGANELTYNTKEQDIQLDNYDSDSVICENTKATNVGNYTAKCSLLNKEEYIWSDGTIEDVKIPWKITPLDIDITIKGKEKKVFYNGKEQMLKDYTISNSEIVQTNRDIQIKGINVGVYPLSIKTQDFIADANYNAHYNIENGKLIIVQNHVNNLKSKLKKYNSANIYWSKIENVDGYNLYYKEDGKAYSKPIRLVKNNYTKSNLLKGKKYYFKIVPYIMINNKIVESSFPKTTRIDTLKKMNTPILTKYNRHTVKVKWSKMNGASGYQIAKSTSKTKGYSISKTISSAYSNAKIKVLRNKTYYYKIRAYKIVDGKKIYAPWSNMKAYKLK